jgi:hypothetical protein
MIIVTAINFIAAGITKITWQKWIVVIMIHKIQGKIETFPQ